MHEILSKQEKEKYIQYKRHLLFLRSLYVLIVIGSCIGYFLFTKKGVNFILAYACCFIVVECILHYFITRVTNRDDYKLYKKTIKDSEKKLFSKSSKKLENENKDSQDEI